MHPVDSLRRIAFLLERAHAPTYRVQAFRKVADLLAGLDAADLRQRCERGTLRELDGVGDTTARVVEEAARGQVPTYLAKLEDEAGPLATSGHELRAALRGDLHSHSSWSDGGRPLEEMALTARELGHEYLALTDHSPRLTVANGLSPQRLRDQLDVVGGVDAALAPFRLLTGIEVDILDDGGLDQEEGLLDALDIVVASVHSKLRMDSAAMTRRMLAAVANSRVDILGHCTGRLLTGRRAGGKARPESEFDAAAVFAACAERGVAVEVNCRPERRDPPSRLLRMAVDAGCLFSIDTDAHAPGQLDWQPYGCERAQACGVPADRVVNSWPVQDLLDWTSRQRT